MVLDTHAWIWWVSDPAKLSQAARRAIEAARTLRISAISCWEFARLVSKGRISVDRGPLEWMRQALAQPRVELIPVTPEVAVTAAQLGESFPGDPADRLIVATAIQEGVGLVTKDDRLRRIQSLDTVW